MKDRPRFDDMPEPAQRLANFMSNLSEKHWCAGWLDNTELYLWNIVNGGDRHWGAWAEPVGVTQEEIDQLKALSDECGGWVAWHRGEVFVPLREWIKEYNRRTTAFPHWRR